MNISIFIKTLHLRPSYLFCCIATSAMMLMNEVEASDYSERDLLNDSWEYPAQQIRYYAAPSLCTEQELWEAAQNGSATPEMIYELGDRYQERGLQSLADFYHQKAIENGYSSGQTHTEIPEEKKYKSESPSDSNIIENQSVEEPSAQDSDGNGMTEQMLNYLKIGLLHTMNEEIANDTGQIRTRFLELTDKYHGSGTPTLSVSKVEATSVAIETFDGNNVGAKGENISKIVYTIKTTWNGWVTSEKETYFLLSYSYTKGTHEVLPAEYKFQYSTGKTDSDAETDWEILAAAATIAGVIFGVLYQIFGGEQAYLNNDYIIHPNEMVCGQNSLFPDNLLYGLSLT